MKDKKHSEDILEKIKKDAIVPKTHFQLHWKNYIFWIVWGVIVFFGAVSFSLLLLNILDIRPIFLLKLGVGPYLRLLMQTTPCLWLGLVGVAGVSSFFVMRKTRTGYRYSIMFITAIIVLLISVLGTVLHFSKINQRIESRTFENKKMTKMLFPAQERLSRAQDGILGGRVTDFSENTIEIINLKGEEWTVSYDSETVFRTKKDLGKGEHLLFIGNLRNDGIFEVELVNSLPRHLKHSKLNESFEGGIDRHFDK